MSNLHRPVVVNPQYPNLADVDLTVHCVPGGYLTRGRASQLCQKVGPLFENQGARVTTIATEARYEDGGTEPDLASDDGTPVPTGPSTSLTIELRARKIHKENHPLSWIAFLGSFTLIPGIQEYTFAQDVTIRDDTGFLLVQESLQGRVTARAGAGAWLGNILLDNIWRKKEERIIGVSVTRDLSTDLYGQLSQMAYNARGQARILSDATPKPRRDSAAPPADEPVSLPGLGELLQDAEPTPGGVLGGAQQNGPSLLDVMEGGKVTE